ncbi:RNA polymerase sigma-B factor [Allocatelliglobosispora scoriae]|uniref:RNA polymerase sigma-B factor n=1 Tax=Allocatelliglobosispora scoriae TaxID=643052 RepID=A0A841BEZ6_9ACTN|nr:SigB/SigF/SigG family RNA polymerase sigma factor [Allocatelliglobosispora scoriae]MBB5867657.1 RNA polymerase sigma-B factor [Allocatelliglobosispora scoriae]
MSTQTGHAVGTEAVTVEPAVSSGATAGHPLQTAFARDEHVEISLLTLLSTLPAGHPERLDIRNRLIMLYAPLAKHFARRMCHSEESLEDIQQVAMIGLIKAVDGFDLQRGVAFTAYASPTIIGEIKRYFRDKGWSLRVPRRLKELKSEIAKALEVLSQRDGVRPGVPELAEYLGASQEDVAIGLELGTAQRAISLQTVIGSAAGQPIELGELLGGDDPALDSVESRMLLRDALAKLGDRERKMIALRFLDNRTQTEIAETLGISQMHVSRLLTKALAKLRTELEHSA